MTNRRNTIVLVTAAAVLALVLGFSYGTTFNGGCAQIKDAPFGCLEWWLSRYQTLVAMFGAIFVGWLSIQPVLKQLKLSSLQTAVGLQQVLAEREKLLLSWIKSELTALEKLDEDLTRGYYEHQDESSLTHWVWDMNHTVQNTRDRLIQRQNKYLGGAHITAARQKLIEILVRLSECMSDFNGSIYADDPEYELSADDRAKIIRAEGDAERDLPDRINAVSAATKEFRKAVAMDLGELRKKRQLYDRILASADIPEDGVA